MRLQVAGRQFELTHDDPELATAAETIFSTFARASGGRASGAQRRGPRDGAWTLRFRRGEACAPQEMSYTCTRESETRFAFNSPGAFTGWIDAATREAEIALASPIVYGLAQRNVLRFALILDLQLSGGLVFHAASRVFGGNAYVFVGRSEVGKSTLARAFPLADFLGDELCFVDADHLVHRTPFFGEVPAPDGELTAPLAMMLALAQAPALVLTPMSISQATRALLATTVHLCHDPALTRALVDRVLAWCERLPVMRAAVPRFSPGELEPVMAELDRLRHDTLAALPRPA